MDFRTQTLDELVTSVRRGSVSAVELTAHALERIEALNPVLNAFTYVDGDRALSEAKALDQRRARGEELGALAGIPIGVKDLDDVAGMVTTHGSVLHRGNPPARVDSILVRRLRDDGCVIVGKTNTPEFGASPDTVNSLYGATRNPWNPAHSPGGSSGGSAAAVAAGMVPLATGSDGGGSLRIPSSCCGLSGIKPSHGRVPSGGAQPPDWHDLSTKGVLARRISDVAYALDAVIGPDPSDLRALPMPDVSWLDAIQEPRVPLQVLWSPPLGYGPPDPEVRAICERAVATLEQLGAVVDTSESVFPEDPILTWMTLVSAYCARVLEPYRGSPEYASVATELASNVERGCSLRAVDLVRAVDECHRLNVRLVSLFHQHRLLVTPTIATAPPLSGELGTIGGEPQQNWVCYTYPFNMTRSPAATVCAGFTASGLPVGLQLVGPQHADQVVLRAAAALEAALALDTVAPGLPGPPGGFSPVAPPG